MSVRFKDYYQILGVSRDADAAAIKKAFRELARKYHPDVSKESDATERFTEINEAYEVLKDPEKRKRYDTLGVSYANGQSFEPPPGFEGMNFDFGDGRGQATDFSDFFSMLFGRGGFGGGGGGFGDAFGGRAPRRARGHDVEAELRLTLAELAQGGKKQFALRDEAGNSREFAVTIPAGTTDGTRIRLAGQGGPGAAGGTAGDLFLRVRVEPDPRFEVDGADLRTTLDVAPWEAALGESVEVPTLDGSVVLKVPAGTASGQTLRLRGLGLPRAATLRGDLLVRVRIVVPKGLSDDERRLFEELRERSQFRPRG